MTIQVFQTSAKTTDASPKPGEHTTSHFPWPHVPVWCTAWVSDTTGPQPADGLVTCTICGVAKEAGYGLQGR